MISSFCFSLRRPCGNLKFANGIAILLLVLVPGMCMDGSVLAANVVKDLKGFICRVLSVVNAMNSTAHD
jgi:hypothetical protein